MSNAKVCDKCSKVIIDYDETVKEPGTPDYVAFIRGTEIVNFQDLCETCLTRVVTNSDKHINVATRVRQSNKQLTD